MGRVLLAIMPWWRPVCPAIGASLLKAALAHREIPCDLAYFNFLWRRHTARQLAAFSANLGRSVLSMQDVQETVEWECIGECFFGKAVHGRGLPRDPPDFDALCYVVGCAKAAGAAWRFLRHLVADVPAFIEDCFDRVMWDDYELVGFSSSFDTLMASLALARLIKERRPDMPIVFGGANCEGEVGEAILEEYRFVDAVFTGEADETFPEFAENLLQSGHAPGLPGVVQRRNGACLSGGPPEPVRNLDPLPDPDYDDYFEQHDTRGLPSFAGDFFLPVESTRGCSWAATGNQCVFCGLNGRRVPYRRKSPARVLDEVRRQTERYHPAQILFVDTVFPTVGMHEWIPRLAEIAPDTGYACEVRPVLSRRDVQCLRRAGVHYLQPGIESLSTPVLDIMRKGVTALQNVACLRYCREAGILPSWNLLYGFPGEDPAEYERILDMLTSITHLEPPDLIEPMRLVRFSPGHGDPERFGFLRCRPHPACAAVHALGPGPSERLCRRFSFDFPDGRDPESYLAPIKEFVRRWKGVGRNGHLVYEPLAGGRAVIYDTRFNRAMPTVALDPAQRSIYEFCDEIRTRSQINEMAAENGEYARISAEQVGFLLDGLEKAHVVAHEGDSYLSLAMMDHSLVPWSAFVAPERSR